MNLYLMKIHHKNLLHHQLHPITILQLLPQMTAHLQTVSHLTFQKDEETPQTEIPFDKSRHPSQDQSNSLPPPIDRNTKTHYDLRHQPK